MKSFQILLVMIFTLVLCALWVYSTATSVEQPLLGTLNGWHDSFLWGWSQLLFLIQWLLWGMALVGLGDLVGWKKMCDWGRMAGIGLRLALGYAVLSLGNFLLGILSGITPLTVLLLPVLGLVWALWRLLQWWLDTRKHTCVLKERIPYIFTLWEIVLVCGISLLGLWYLFFSFLPETSWDSLVYQLYLPKLWLSHGFMYAPPWNDYARMPLLMSLVYTSGLALPLAEAGARGASLWATLGGALLAGSVARRGLGRPAAWVTILIILAEPVIGGEIGVTSSDAPAILFLFAAWVFLFPPQGKKPSPLLAGIMAGCLLGIKLVAVYSVLAIGLILLYLWMKRKPDSLKTLLYYIFGTLAAFLPWILRSAWLTGNPFFPFAANILGSGDMPPLVARQLSSWLWGMGMGRGMVDYLLLPMRIFFAAGPGYQYFDGMVNPVHLVLIPLGLMALLKDEKIRQILAAALLIFIFWAVGPQQLRFLTPALVLLAVAWGRLSELWSGLTLWLIRSITSMGVILGAAFLFTSVFMMDIPAVLGGIDLANYRNSQIQILPACTWIDRNLPADARVVMIFYNRGYACPRPVLAESYFEASRFGWEARELGAEGLARWLISSGYEFVLVSKNPFFQNTVLGMMEEGERAEVLKFLSQNIAMLHEDDEAMVGRIITR